MKKTKDKISDVKIKKKFEKIRERVESWKSKGRLKNRNAWFSDDLCFGKTAQRVTLRQSLSK